MAIRDPRVYILIFALSGFAGLIYESIWTHYLKLFLGHAAYAQALVLSIFMGGMALGAWVCSHYSKNWPNLLRGYALAELAIGLLALSFHPLFDGFLDLAYRDILPALDSPAASAAFQWTSGTLLILPQSILLGMSFPLMAAGVIRIAPQHQGATVSLLYFSNSMGAAIGVLASGFVLIRWLGLAGTIGLSGLLNVCLAILVWRIAPTAEAVTEPTATARQPSRHLPQTYVLFLAVAFVTGMASFLYEIGWIRMLTLVLGASTHAFELMLSAFITGLALGGLWIRGRIDRLQSPKAFLGGVQLIMGLLALATLPLYGNTFGLMGWLIEHLDKTETGYTLFNLGSHAIALAIMLPATFCAGMTLPLITYILLRGQLGERSIGAVYAVNTAGAIVGVLLAVHIGLPVLGLKGTLVLGAALDIALGIGLLWTAGRSPAKTALAGLFGLGALALTLGLVELSAHQMASGVYRAGTLFGAEIEVPFHRDGKTATVSVTRRPDGQYSIRTNGKADAGLYVNNNKLRHPDEHTMILAALLPLALHPDAKEVANIGLGSGLTTHTLLGNPGLREVDTIEIEATMAQAIRHFRPRIDRALDDPRSRLFIEDAKSFFSSHHKQYDIIISEPSNPWVSGVAGLFSEEFYSRVKDYLKPGGLLVQWMQLYEIDLPLVISVLKALAPHYEDYEIYAANYADILIVARPEGVMPDPDPWLFEEPALLEQLQHISINSVNDLEVRWVGNKQTFAPLLANYPIAANSDYYPVLDQYAARARFMNSSVTQLQTPELDRLVGLRQLGGHAGRPNPAAITVDKDIPASTPWALAQTLLDYYRTGRWKWDHTNTPLPAQIQQYAELGRLALNNCGSGLPVGRWVGGAYNSIAKRILPYLDAAQGTALLTAITSPECRRHLMPLQRHFSALLMAIARRDGAQMSHHARRILESVSFQDPDVVEFLVATGMRGDLAQGKKEAARALLMQYGSELKERLRESLALPLLAAHSGYDLSWPLTFGTYLRGISGPSSFWRTPEQ